MPSATTTHCLSLQARLRLVFLLGMLGSALLVVLMVSLLGERFSHRLLAQKTELFAEFLTEHLAFDAAGQAVGFDAAVAPWILQSLAAEMQVRIVAADGRVPHSNGDARPLGPYRPGALPSADSVPTTWQGVTMHLATRTRLHQGQRWTVQFAASERFIGFLRETYGSPGMRRGVLAMSAVFLVVFLLSFQVLLRRGLRPLQAASMAAQRISPRALGERLDTAAQPAEIRPLVQAFNQALDRLQQGFEAQQRFLASAAHELKTPLALIRAQVELNHPGAERHALLADIDRMARQVQQLLVLAESSEPMNYQLTPQDPEPVLVEVCEVMARVADRRAVMLHWRIECDRGHWRMDRGALFTLAKNLLENAIQHSPPGSDVHLQANAEGLAVSDAGPGVAPQDLPRLFDRFWRGADRRDEGAGLGLSICAAIAEAHGWRIEPQPLARGLRMRVHIAPPAKPEAAA